MQSLASGVLESIKPADEALTIARARRMQLPEPDCQATRKNYPWKNVCVEVAFAAVVAVVVVVMVAVVGCTNRAASATESVPPEHKSED